MKESPILFQPWKVRKILKWDWRGAGDMQTRRIIEPQPFKWAERIEPGPFDCRDGTYGLKGDWIQMSQDTKHMLGLGRCRYGESGDALWVKETWCGSGFIQDPYQYKSSYLKDEPQPKWKSSLYMPKRAARIWLTVVDVRAERLQDIDNHDAWKEGIPPFGQWLKNEGSARDEYHRIWDNINGKKEFPWESNPWVSVVTFSLKSLTVLLKPSNPDVWEMVA